MTYDEAREVLRLMADEVGTVHQVNEYLEAIRTLRDDDEAAHAAEDDLRGAVLHAIMKGNTEDEPHEVAAAVLESRHIKFARWCA